MATMGVWGQNETYRGVPSLPASVQDNADLHQIGQVGPDLGSVPDGDKRDGPEHRDHAWLSGQSDRTKTVLWAAYALMGVLLVGYLASLIVRGPDRSSQLLDGWLVAGFEMAAAALCITRGLTRRPGRAVALTLGSGLIMWSLGDIALTVESLGGVTPPTPSLADVFYLGFYPLTYVAAVIFMRGEVRRLATPSW